MSISSNKCVFVLNYTVETLARKEEIQAGRATERESPRVRRSEYDNFNEN